MMRIARNVKLSFLFVVATLLVFGATPVSSQEFDTDRPGFDFQNFDLGAADYSLCAQACNSDDRCEAWTYVKPGIQGPMARCWLKTAVPAAIASNCCISGSRSTSGATWRHVGTEYELGPLSCNLPRELLDWDETPSEGVEGQPYAGAVKYQSGDTGRVESMALHAWSNPVLASNGTWLIHLSSWALLGNPVTGIVTRVQRLGETDPNQGPEVANSRLLPRSAGDNAQRRRSSIRTAR